MKYTLLRFLAIFIPCIYFTSRKNYKAAFICALMQISIIGWIPASILAVLSIEDSRTAKKMEGYLKNVQQYKNLEKPSTEFPVNSQRPSPTWQS